MIYGLYNKNTGEVRYVGRTGRSIRGRLHNHRYNAKTKKCNSPKGKWIRKIEPGNVEIMNLENPDENEKRKELWWMEYLEYLGCNLLNVAKYDTGAEAGKLHNGKLPKDCIKNLGKVSDVKLAKKYEVNVKTIKARRIQRGIDPYSRKYDLPNECINQLGKKSDNGLAEKYDVSREVIRRRRNERNVDAYDEDKKLTKREAGEIKWMIKHSDSIYKEIANKYDVSKSCVGEIASNRVHKQVHKEKPKWVN